MSFTYLPASATTNTVQLSGTPTTVLVGTGNAYSNGSATLATITAGKTGYVIGANLNQSRYGLADGNQTTADIKLDGTSILSGTMTASTAITAGANNLTLSLPVGFGIPIAATKAITLVISGTSGAKNGATATVLYIEV